MLFNSIQFLLFFIGIVGLFYITPHKFRWLVLLVSSYFFYMNWKPVYALLMLFSTFVTWLGGIGVERVTSRSRKKQILALTLILNLSILFLFKYYNFINESIIWTLQAFHLRWPLPELDVLLPVGISFYTFQAIGYTIDVYRGTIKAEQNFGIYALFVSFFPQLVAGPIERAKHLLPQFREVHLINPQNLVIGSRQMIWGYFMKVVVADRLALYVDAVYNHVDLHNGSSFLIATFFFAFQIYCDFAGYSLIAIGAARVLGFDIMTNFNRPYFALSITDFWRRWHISLSTWFKDYLYIPLGGSRVGKWRNYLNLMITFVISGLWHGANWTFVFWGFLHGFFLVVEKIFRLNEPGRKKNRLIRQAAVFLFVLITWVFFRSKSIQESFLIINKMVFDLGVPYKDGTTLLYSFIGLSILLLFETQKEVFSGKLSGLLNKNPVVSAATFALLITLILLIGVFDGGQFIYFQF